MAFENLKAGRDSLNVTVAQGQQVVADIIAAGLDQNKPVALFANPTDGHGGLMVPFSAKQDNGTAPWVDTSSDIESLGVPAAERIFLQVWVESHGVYYMVGGILKSLKYETIKDALG